MTTHELPYLANYWHSPRTRRRLQSTLDIDVVVIGGPPSPEYSRLDTRFTLGGETHERSTTFTTPFEGRKLELPVPSEAEDVEVRWREPGS